MSTLSLVFLAKQKERERERETERDINKILLFVLNSTPQPVREERRDECSRRRVPQLNVCHMSHTAKCPFAARQCCAADILISASFMQALSIPPERRRGIEALLPSWL